LGKASRRYDAVERHRSDSRGRLESDAQLAAILADNIACALEKQDLRAIPARRALLASDVSLYAGGAVVPGLGLAPVLTDGVAKTQMQRRAEEQSGRVSLVLLRQAGYDITEAPRCGGRWRR
jgi:hypothetical protein